MATTEKTTKVETDVEQVEEPVVETQPEQAAITEQPVETRPMTRQSLITIAIISGMILFFLGLGLGFMAGNRLDSQRIRTYNQGQLPGGMMRRGYYQDDTQTTPSQGTTNNNTQIN